MEHSSRGSRADVEVRPSIIIQRVDSPNDCSDDDIELGVRGSCCRPSYAARQTFPSNVGCTIDADMPAEINSLSRITVQTLDEDDDQSNDAARNTVQSTVTQDGAAARRSIVARATRMDVSFQVDRNSCSSHSSHHGYFRYESDDDDAPLAEDVIQVVHCSQEWGGFNSDSSMDSGKSSIGWFRSRIRKLRKSLRCTTERRRMTSQKNNVDRKTLLETFATDVFTIIIESVQGMRCIWFTILYLAQKQQILWCPFLSRLPPPSN
eukprot:GEMP01077024.1.p1 GENE.GEMP01077024.1~~GEMP01077024.1.p1  ORF type:complete len:264 (+),score=54.11 GEMP01077024.1:93-884(+)